MSWLAWWALGAVITTETMARAVASRADDDGKIWAFPPVARVFIAAIFVAAWPMMWPVWLVQVINRGIKR